MENDNEKSLNNKGNLTQDQINWCNEFIDTDEKASGTWSIDKKGFIMTANKKIYFKNAEKMDKIPISFGDCDYVFFKNCKILKNLYGCPRNVGAIDIELCPKIENLEGGPFTCQKNYRIKNCVNLKSLRKISEIVVMNLWIEDCPRLRDVESIKNMDECGNLIIKGKTNIRKKYFWILNDKKNFQEWLKSNYDLKNFWIVLRRRYTANMISNRLNGVRESEGSDSIRRILRFDEFTKINEQYDKEDWKNIDFSTDDEKAVADMVEEKLLSKDLFVVYDDDDEFEKFEQMTSTETPERVFETSDDQLDMYSVPFEFLSWTVVGSDDSEILEKKYILKKTDISKI